MYSIFSWDTWWVNPDYGIVSSEPKSPAWDKIRFVTRWVKITPHMSLFFLCNPYRVFNYLTKDLTWSKFLFMKNIEKARTWWAIISAKFLVDCMIVELLPIILKACAFTCLSFLSTLFLYFSFKFARCKVTSFWDLLFCSGVIF